MKHILRFTVFLSLCLLGVVTSYGQQLPFQGRLMQNNLPVNDTLEISFAVPAASWTETHPAVIVTEGLYSVVLGSVSPMPESLFDGLSEQSLEIAINGTSLSPVILYPSLTKPRSRISKELGAAVVSDTALFTTVTGGANTGYNIAAYTEMSTNAGNITYYGKTVSKAGTTQTQYGIVGEALGEGAGLHLGVYGEAAGKGKSNIGMYGLAYGEGNGDQGYGTGSYSNGVIGKATNNSWGNSGVYGHAYGTKGVDNIGVVGWSEVKTGSDTTVNSGLLGWAKGTGVNRGVVGLATGGAHNWAGWFEGDVKMEGKYLHARVDSITVNDSNGRQAVVIESMFGGAPTSFIGGYGSNGKGNFYLYSNGPDRNYGNLGLKNAEGVTKAWLSAFYTQQTGQAAGLLSLYGPTGGWIGGGFQHWLADSAINLPYISLEGNKQNQALLWMSVNRNQEGTEYGAIDLTAADGRHLRIDAYTQLGIPTQGPNSENFLMSGKDWEGKGDYPLFELRGTINSMADGTGYTLPLMSLNTTDNGTEEWGIFTIESGAIGGSSTKNMIYMGVGQHTSGQSGEVFFKGPNSDNVYIGGLGWETNAGSERGRIAVMGNSSRSDGNGGTYNPALVNMEVSDNGTKQFGRLSVSDQSGAVYLEMMAEADGKIRVGNGTGHVEMFGNGNLNATGNITAFSVTNTSDRRYKENILPLQNSLANVGNLKGVSYYWKDKNHGNGRQIGLIAQEVEAIYPEFVHTNEEGYKSVNYAGMVAVLIEAVKELESQVKALEQDNAGLSSENAALKASLESGMNSLNERMLQLEKMLGQQAAQASAQSSSASSAGR